MRKVNEKMWCVWGSKDWLDQYGETAAFIGVALPIIANYSLIPNVSPQIILYCFFPLTFDWDWTHIGRGETKCQGGKNIKGFGEGEKVLVCGKGEGRTKKKEAMLRWAAKGVIYYYYYHRQGGGPTNNTHHHHHLYCLRGSAAVYYIIHIVI